MKSQEIFTFDPNYLKTKKMYKHAVTKIKIKIKLEVPFLIRYVSDQYKNEPKCNKTILEKRWNMVEW